MPVAAKTWVRAVTAAVAVTIVVLSLLPVPQPRLPRVQYLDKILHALAYLLLSFLLFASQLPARAAAGAGGGARQPAARGLIELIQP
jgi:VanZ family protein